MRKADDAGGPTTACDREPIHVPGSIQPHGLLLIADRARRLVVGGAGAIEQRLTPLWLGRPLGMLLAQDIAGALAEAEGGVPVALAPVPGRREAFDAVLHAVDDLVAVELEPRSDDAIGAGPLLSRLDGFAAAFERAGSVQALCESAAAGFRVLTGFDRVMIYRLHDDGAGMVVAEDRDAAMPSFLDHHFPATDIPRQARALYLRNRVRVIPDVHYVAAPIRPEQDHLLGLDLSDVALRSVSPIHLQYLRTMGVAASASVSIVKDGRLWGLVTCHHRTPHMMGYELRTACRALAGALARQINAKEDADLHRERIRLRQAEDRALAQFGLDRADDRIFADMADDLRQMIDADGFAAIRGARVDSAGVVPSPADLEQLARWVAPHAAARPFVTAGLQRRFAPAAAYRDIASGLLAVRLKSDDPALLLWFLRERPETIRWAGPPDKAEATEGGALVMPRSSFAAWQETVRGRARRWTAGEIEAAARLSAGLFEVGQTTRLRELNRELGAIVAQKEALLAEKDHLLREVNHRVQNSLQLVQAFLALQARETAPDVTAPLGEAQRRLAAVALVHRRLYQADQLASVDLARYLQDLVDDMRASMGSEWAGAVETDLRPVALSPDRALNIGLVVTELVINAQKYAYAGRPGPIAITLAPQRGDFRLVVADRGTGGQRAQAGFGTRMIAAMVEKLEGTIERLDNRPGLRVVVTARAGAHAAAR